MATIVFKLFSTYMAGEHGKMVGNSFFACQIPNAQLSIMGHMHSVTYMDSQIP